MLDSLMNIHFQVERLFARKNDYGDDIDLEGEQMHNYFDDKCIITLTTNA